MLTVTSPVTAPVSSIPVAVRTAAGLRTMMSPVLMPAPLAASSPLTVTSKVPSFSFSSKVRVNSAGTTELSLRVTTSLSSTSLVRPVMELTPAVTATAAPLRVAVSISWPSGMVRVTVAEVSVSSVTTAAVAVMSVPSAAMT